MKLYKYCAKNNENRESSWWNGKERIGFESVIVDESKVDSYLSKGWVKGLPEKTKRKAKKNESIDKRCNTESSPESSGATDQIQISND